MREEWVSVGDARVCPDCEELAGEIKDSREWDAEGRPRERETACGDRCRCMLIAVEDENTELIDAYTDRIMDKLQVAVDDTAGRKLTLNEHAERIGLLDLPYKVIAQYERMIRRYNATNGALPEEFYEIGDIRGQMEWLEKKT